jgi:hypothetical protein
MGQCDTHPSVFYSPEDRSSQSLECEWNVNIVTCGDDG